MRPNIIPQTSSTHSILPGPGRISVELLKPSHGEGKTSVLLQLFNKLGQGGMYQMKGRWPTLHPHNKLSR